jgi:hypothetical protein
MNQGIKWGKKQKGENFLHEIKWREKMAGRHAQIFAN